MDIWNGWNCNGFHCHLIFDILQSKSCCCLLRRCQQRVDTIFYRAAFFCIIKQTDYAALDVMLLQTDVCMIQTQQNKLQRYSKRMFKSWVQGDIWTFQMPVNRFLRASWRFLATVTWPWRYIRHYATYCSALLWNKNIYGNKLLYMKKPTNNHTENSNTGLYLRGKYTGNDL